MDIRQGEMVMSRTTRRGQTSFGHALMLLSCIYSFSNLVMWVSQIPKQKYIALNLFMNN